jgi:hypothetical protein
MKAIFKFQFVGYSPLIGKVAGISQIMTAWQLQANEINRIPDFARISASLCTRVYPRG